MFDSNCNSKDYYHELSLHSSDHNYNNYNPPQCNCKHYLSLHILTQLKCNYSNNNCSIHHSNNHNSSNAFFFNHCSSHQRVNPVLTGP